MPWENVMEEGRRPWEREKKQMEERYTDGDEEKGQVEA